MKTEIENKLNKLPYRIISASLEYNLIIEKSIGLDNKPFWIIKYKNKFDGNVILDVVNTSLQAAVDTTLKEIKNI